MRRWQKNAISSYNEELDAGDAAAAVTYKVDAPGLNCQTIPAMDGVAEPHNS